MRSIGIDNIGLPITFSQWNEVKRYCHYTKGNASAFIPDKIFFEPKLSYVLMKINIPKLVFGHNIILAQPKDIEKAFLKCEELLPFQINVLESELRLVHFTYTQDSQYSYNVWKDNITIPKRGKWKLMEEENGVYFNNVNKEEVIVFYGKGEHIKAKGRSLPLSVRSECEYENIIRLEQRIERSVRKKLKGKGLWIHHSLRCSDLLTPEGFIAFVKFFQWRATQCIEIRKEKNARVLSYIEKAILSRPYETVKFFREKLSDEDYYGMLNDISAFQKKERAKELLLGINEECKKVYECYGNGVPIAGNIDYKELIYA